MKITFKRWKKDYSSDINELINIVMNRQNDSHEDTYFIDMNFVKYRLSCTSATCPESYVVINENSGCTCGTIRLRFGILTCTPNPETSSPAYVYIFETDKMKGNFDNELERHVFLKECVKKLHYLEESRNGRY